MSSASRHIIGTTGAPSFGNLHDDVAPHDRLAAQARVDGEAFGGVQAILLVGFHLGQVLLAFLDDHVTGRARAVAPAVVLQVDIVGQRDVEQGPRLAVVGQRVLLVVHLHRGVHGQKRHLVHGHYWDSMISLARRVPSADLRALSIMSSARCSVAWFRATVRWRIDSRSVVSRAWRSASRAVVMRARSSSETRASPWRSARWTCVITVAASLRISTSIRASTSASAY